MNAGDTEAIYELFRVLVSLGIKPCLSNMRTEGVQPHPLSNKVMVFEDPTMRACIQFFRTDSEFEDTEEWRTSSIFILVTDDQLKERLGGRERFFIFDFPLEDMTNLVEVAIFEAQIVYDLHFGSQGNIRVHEIYACSVPDGCLVVRIPFKHDRTISITMDRKTFEMKIAGTTESRRSLAVMRYSGNQWVEMIE